MMDLAKKATATITSMQHKHMLIVVLLTGCFFRFYKIDFQSPWLDEVHTINEVDPRLSPQEIFKIIKIAEPSPPLYFILNHYATKLFGYSVLVIRSVSGIFGILGIVYLYVLGKEMFDKRVGLIASILLTVNPFHIYYSQEARMYSLLFFSSTFSYYYLIRFIRSPSFRLSAFYALSTTLLLYSHFFGFFVLASQCVVLSVYFLLRKDLSLLKYSLISGVLTIIFYIPGFPFLLAAMERNQIWIPLPTLNTLLGIFKDFCGQSQVLIYVTVGLITLSILLTFSPKRNLEHFFSASSPNHKSNLLVLLTWFIVTLTIPMVLSYAKLPMIVNRYLICLLPAVLILAAVGISCFKRSAVIIALTALFVFLSCRSLTDQNYYSQVGKQQFRELTKINFKPDEPVVSPYSWHLPFFVQKTYQTPSLIGKDINDYIKEVSKDTSKLSSFWYIDLTFQKIPMEDSTSMFLANHYMLDCDFTLYGVKALHFMILKEFDFQSKIDLQLIENDFEKNAACDTRSNIESFTVNPEVLNIAGWIYLSNEDSFNSRIKAFAKNNQMFVTVPVTAILRQEIAPYFGSSYNLDFSGFKIDFQLHKLPRGKYDLYIFLSNGRLERRCVVPTGKSFEVNN